MKNKLLVLAAASFIVVGCDKSNRNYVGQRHEQPAVVYENETEVHNHYHTTNNVNAPAVAGAAAIGAAGGYAASKMLDKNKQQPNAPAKVVNGKPNSSYANKQLPVTTVKVNPTVKNPPPVTAAKPSNRFSLGNSSLAKTKVTVKSSSSKKK